MQREGIVRVVWVCMSAEEHGAPRPEHPLQEATGGQQPHPPGECHSYPYTQTEIKRNTANETRLLPLRIHDRQEQHEATPSRDQLRASS